MTDKKSQVPFSTVASFAEHLTEMLNHLQDVPEFKKRQFDPAARRHRKTAR
jgi:hypothetical protein